MRNWTTEDIVRFESYRLLDEGSDGEALEVRDRAFYQGLSEPDLARNPLFRTWLDFRLKNEPFKVDPGGVLKWVFFIMGWLLSLGGVIAGTLITYATLRYDGSVPVNISVFLGIVIVPQIFLLFLLMFLLAVSVFSRSAGERLYRLPIAFVSLSVRLIWDWLMKIRSIPAKDRDHLNCGTHAFHDIFKQYQSLMSVRTFAYMQRFGVFFNIGVILCSGALLMFSDRAFGWQSSLTDSPEMVAGIVRVIATPWHAWWGEGIGSPSVEQIQGSYIVLRDEWAELDNKNLVSWWPFLLLSVCFYGLLPRIAGWGLSSIWERRSVRTVGFHSIHYNPLWERMHSISLESVGNEAVPGKKEMGTLSHAEDSYSAKDYQLWISQEMKSRYDSYALLAWAKDYGNLPVEGISEYGDWKEFVLQLNKLPPIMLLEGWQPPIQEKLDDLKVLAQSDGLAAREIFILLLGKPSTTGACRALPPEMHEVWKNKLRLLGIPNFHLLPNQGEPS